jgi:hypothetical protein
MLQLVKDFKRYQISFYWINAEKKQVSPDLPTLNHAKEWYFEHLFDQFNGVNRRKRKFDRRHSGHNEAELHSKRSFKKPNGRRSTDKPIKVEIDLSEKKISNLKNAV